MRIDRSTWRYREIREVALDRHGLITAEDLRSLGVASSTTSDWCAGDVLVRLAPRVYLLPELLDDRSHLAAQCLSMPEAVASHRAAALLWDLDGIESEVVELTVPHQVQRRGGGVIHRSGDLAESEVVELAGIRCTDPTRTLVDLGAVVELDVVERALESALRRRLTSVSRLQWRLRELARPGRPGPATLRQALHRRPPRAPATESDLETLFLQSLRAAGVREPVRQHPVRLPDGSVVRLDLAYPDDMVFPELDGWATHGTREAFDRDRRRQNAIVLLGWRPLRFTWAAVVHHPDRVAAEVQAALTGRGAPAPLVPTSR